MKVLTKKMKMELKRKKLNFRKRERANKAIVEHLEKVLINRIELLGKTVRFVLFFFKMTLLIQMLANIYDWYVS